MPRVHFVGIGGTGISALALLLLERGWEVSGTDMHASPYFNKVTQSGARTLVGHHPEIAEKAEFVVRSSAVKESDPEVVAAKNAGVPVMRRIDFLPMLTEGYTTLAVAGSHGKTTTTAMLVTLMQALDEDVTYILGAEIKALGANAHHGLSEYLVIEADEYDFMFLGLDPKVSLITNIEHDHPDCFPTERDYLNAFSSFVDRTVPRGVCIACGDNTGVQSLQSMRKSTSPMIKTFGFSAVNEYLIQQLSWQNACFTFTLTYHGEPLGSFKLGLPGKHNVLNAAGALAVLNECGFDLSKLSTALRVFSGTERRFDIVYDREGVVILNDYGHHPTQINAVLSAARDLYPEKTLWAVWEPHTYSRTLAMQDEFIHAFSLADKVRIARIYAAREEDTGITPAPIAAALPDASYFFEYEDLAENISQNLRGDDLVVVLSAGKGPMISHMVMEKIAQKTSKGSE
ncbi:MAG: UDP-N-acetylmuramate--L-alanine ligase [Anaerolineaceae bacterium]|jgi:UDP-N-acetylmuramate--alanine ligase